MSESRKQIAVDNILIAAERCFGLNGPSISIQKVASEAGMSKQALMHHFPSKKQLVDAVWERVIERAQRFQPALLRSLMNDAHEDELSELLEEFAVNPYWAQFLLREWMERGPDGLPDALLLGHSEFQLMLGQLETPSGIDFAAAWVNLNLSLLVTLASSVHEERLSRVSGDAHIGLNRRLSSIRQLYRLLRTTTNP